MVASFRVALRLPPPPDSFHDFSGERLLFDSFFSNVVVVVDPLFIGRAAHEDDVRRLRRNAGVGSFTRNEPARSRIWWRWCRCGGGNKKLGPFYGPEGEQLGGYHTNPVFPAKAAPTAMERGCARPSDRRG